MGCIFSKHKPDPRLYNFHERGLPYPWGRSFGSEESFNMRRRRDLGPRRPRFVPGDCPSPPGWGRGRRQPRHGSISPWGATTVSSRSGRRGASKHHPSREPSRGPSSVDGRSTRKAAQTSHRTEKVASTMGGSTSGRERQRSGL